MQADKLIEGFISAVNLCEKFGKYHDVEWLAAIKEEAEAIRQHIEQEAAQPEPVREMTVEEVVDVIKLHIWEQIGSYVKFKGDITAAAQALAKLGTIRIVP